jgi:hypothetical protein
MLIAVLVLALLGLWTPIVVALFIFREIEREGAEKRQDAKHSAMSRHPAGRALNPERPRVICPVCGAHYQL